MSAAHLPLQPTSSPAPEPPRAVAPYASEATRLLCAGTYLDAEYRNRVIDELYLHDHRFAAPALGFDAARVLAHALRARWVELAWAWSMVGVLAIGVAASGRWLLIMVVPGLLLAFGHRFLGMGRRIPAFGLRWAGRLLLTYLVLVSLAVGLGTEYPGSTGVFGVQLPQPPGRAQAWGALAVLLAMAGCVVAQQAHFTRVLRGELSPQHFPDALGDPAERTSRPRFQRLKDRIRLEQQAHLVMYHEAHPFCGAGIAHDTWVLAVDLRPDPAKDRKPIGNGTVLAVVRPLIEQLREVAASPEHEGRAVRDRLRNLQVDECVFLPAQGLPHRDDAPYSRHTREQHRTHALEEGGEKRRHFLRIRVSGWEEELVVTVFVRVHTQGRMLMLEVAPHVLLPVRADFKDADHEAYLFANQNLLGKAVHIFTRMGSAPGQTLVTLGQHTAHFWRRLRGEFTGGPPEGPALSVRELAAAESGSLFQSMDADRYLKSIQDRIASGVKAALAEAGYQTEEFVQKVVLISSGGVNIESVEDSTFAVGDHAQATTALPAATSAGRTSPQEGADRGGH